MTLSDVVLVAGTLELSSLLALLLSSIGRRKRPHLDIERRTGADADAGRCSTPRAAPQPRLGDPAEARGRERRAADVAAIGRGRRAMR
jgi:hypothetical protein